MTSTEIRIALATFEGYTWKQSHESGEAVWNPKQEWIGSSANFIELLPDYPNCLNAVHELEKKLDANQYDCFICELQQICKSFLSEGGYEVSATASQRCEALLRTLNL